ncbi:MAG: hypothetical protein JO323_21255, partial [Acidobacteriia bacterium]|nr:hypothetical protein [Terriglobia bacterium]
EIASLFGIAGLSGNTTGTFPLGTSLAGVSVNVTDSAGTPRAALLYGVYGSANQINLVIPAGTALGPAVVSVTLPGGVVITTAVNVVNIVPGIYAASDTGQGIYAGQVTYAHKDGTQTVVQSGSFNGASFSPIPINLSTPGDQVYLVLYATGLRHGASLTAAVNGAAIPVAFFGAQSVNPGLDQINLGPLPASLAGAGQANIVVTVDGQAANTVTVSFQ